MAQAKYTLPLLRQVRITLHFMFITYANFRSEMSNGWKDLPWYKKMNLVVQGIQAAGIIVAIVGIIVSKLS
jgi:hypothetical protein